MAAVQNKPALWNKITKFLREVRSEMRKVSWPNRKELITYTIVVLATVVFVAVFTGVVDVIITAVLNLMSQLGG